MYMSSGQLWEVAFKYHKEVQPLPNGFGNGFDRQGRHYFGVLLKGYPHFKAWVGQHYPALLEEEY